VELLGADVNLTSNNSEFNNGVMPSFIAAWRGETSIVQHLIRHGASIEATFSDGEQFAGGDTTLLASAACGHSLTTQYLLEDGGANMGVVNDGGETAGIYL
jgi:ankyrin repeat protein